MCHLCRFCLESPDVVVVLADAGRHPGGQHGAGHGGQGEVPVQVSAEWRERLLENVFRFQISRMVWLHFNIRIHFPENLKINIGGSLKNKGQPYI